QVQGGALAFFGGVAFDPVVGPKWPHLASICKAVEDRPVPVTTTTSGSSGVRRRMSARPCSRAAMSPEPVVSSAVIHASSRLLTWRNGTLLTGTGQVSTKYR